MSWLLLKTLKETNPIQVAKYAQGNQIDTKPAFDWWVPTISWHCTQIIKKGGQRRMHHCTDLNLGFA
jgi:hypothetical protein